jgi:hypothetical protein
LKQVLQRPPEVDRPRLVPSSRTASRPSGPAGAKQPAGRHGARRLSAIDQGVACVVGRPVLGEGRFSEGMGIRFGWHVVRWHGVWRAMCQEKSYRPWSPRQGQVFPPSPLDWLPEDHLAYFVLDVVEELDLRLIEEAIPRSLPRTQATGPRRTRNTARSWVRIPTSRFNARNIEPRRPTPRRPRRRSPRTDSECAESFRRRKGGRSMRAARRWWSLSLGREKRSAAFADSFCEGSRRFAVSGPSFAPLTTF